jgi:hypothetical protein
MRYLNLLIIGLLVGGCGTGLQQRQPVVGAEERQGVPIEVNNGSGATLRVYLLSGNNEMLLGRVEPLRTTTFTLPEGITGSLALAARLGAARDEQHVSEGFNLVSGQRVSWHLHSPLGTTVPRISNIYIFGCQDDQDC